MSQNPRNPLLSTKSLGFMDVCSRQIDCSNLAIDPSQLSSTQVTWKFTSPHIPHSGWFTPHIDRQAGNRHRDSHLSPRDTCSIVWSPGTPIAMIGACHFWGTLAPGPKTSHRRMLQFQTFQKRSKLGSPEQWTWGLLILGAYYMFTLWYFKSSLRTITTF